MAERNVQKEMDALKEELSRLRDDLRTLSGQGTRAAKATRGAAREHAERTKHSLMEEAEELIDRLQEAGESVREGSRETIDSWRQRVEERPFASTLAAMGLGFAVGWLSSRKR